MRLKRFGIFFLAATFVLNPIILNSLYAAPVRNQNQQRQSLTKLHLAAIRGNSAAMYEMGLRQLRGDGFKMDKAKAKKWFERAEKQGHKQAKEALSKLAAGETHTLRRAYHFTEAPVKFSATTRSTQNPSVRKSTTKSVTNPPPKVSVDNKAEEDYQLAKKYYLGLGVSKDPNKTVQYMEKSANAGHARAQLEFGLYHFLKVGKLAKFNNNEYRGRLWIEKSAKQGEAYAQRWLGELLFKGKTYSGRPRKKEAAQWFRKAALQGRSDAQFFLGDMYAGGKGVPINYEEAFGWYRKAAYQNHSVAQYRLALIYDSGQKGVSKSWRNAFRWYKKAADNGHPQAEFAMGLMYYNGKGVRKNISKGFRLVESSARKGYARAQNQTGVMYQYGMGVKKDRKKATQWYKLASNNGHSGGRRNLAKMNYSRNGRNNILAAFLLAALLSQSGRHSSSYDSDWESSTGYRMPQTINHGNRRNAISN